MSDTVKARYMGNESDMRVGDEEIHLQHRHVYDLPKSVVVGRDDFIIQEDDVERAVDTAPEKREGR